jgi:hypothetical protein
MTMSRVCIRCRAALQPYSVLTLLPRRTFSTTRPRRANEGTSPRAQALEVYQVPKSNIPGRTLLTQPTTEDLREKPRWLMSIAMKLFRTRPVRMATQGSKAKAAMREYYALCATRATSDGDETSTGFWYDGMMSLGAMLIFRTWSTAQFR